MAFVEENNILKAMRLLIKSLTEKQEEISSCKTQSDRPNNWMEDSCTIRISSGRRSGHTTAMIKSCVEDFKNPLILTINQEHSRIISNLIEVQYPNLNNHKK